MKYKIGIDASRARSGGGKTHLIGILTEFSIDNHPIEEVHIWTYKGLMDQLPERRWLIKHEDESLEKGLISQLFWQRFILKKELIRTGCDALLSVDAGTIVVHNPSVVMSRDMLSFEEGEIHRFKQFTPWLRLWLLRSIQIKSLRKATGALFLTTYASEVIQKYTGKLSHTRVIPHGVGSEFKPTRGKAKSLRGAWKCVYVSNTAAYKHQWVVAKAFKQLRDEGYDVEIKFIGGGRGIFDEKLNQAIRKFDPNNEFTSRYGFLGHGELSKYLSQADLFVFASSCENMPNTLVEAMACGLPICCSDRGPMPEVLKDGGIYFNPEDADSIAYAVKQHILNPVLSYKLAQKALAYSKSYSWSRCARETFEFLVSVI